jgi:uncharacterized membrane protein YgcG
LNMKGESRSIISLIGIALLIASGVAVTAQAQNREKYVISAKAGGVNLVSGNVTVQRNGVDRPEALTANDNLETGDSVTTGAGGRVEVLLNPGTYMRVDENSEFELANASLDNLRVKLVKGSVLVEATGDDNTNLAIAITTPQTEALIVKRGIYRFNILPNAMTEIAVRKGRALYGKSAVNIIKGGQKLLIGNGRVEVAKLDKKDEDAFDLWSKQRAELLAKVNQRIQGRTLMAAFNTQHWLDVFGFDYGLGYGASNSGFWLYNPSYRSYCFVPHGSRNWSSPYGHPYRNGVESQNPGGGGQGWTRGSGSQPSGNGSPSRGNNPSSGNGNPSAGGSGSSTPWSGNSNPTPAPQPVSQPPVIERSVSPVSAPQIERGISKNPNE